MTSVTFEASVIADAIKRAVRVAPAKSGSAFDKAAGIVLDIYPDQQVQCVLRATNTDVFYAEVLGLQQATGKTVRWRMSSILLGNVFGGLPIGQNRSVTLTQEGTSVVITQGRMKSTIRLMDPTYYPEWDLHNAADLTMVSALGGRIAQVEWAALVGEPPLSGVYLDGQYAIATDKFRIARVPCLVDLPRPVLIPAKAIGELLRPNADVSIGLQGGVLIVAIDDYTQFLSVTYDTPYPATQLERVMVTEFPDSVTLSKTQILDKVTRAVSFAGAERNPTVQLIIGQEDVAVYFSQEEGMFGDVIEVPGSAQHKRVKFQFNPKYLTDSISRAPNEKVTIGYDATAPARPVFIDGGSGYQAWIQPRKDVTPAPTT